MTSELLEYIEYIEENLKMNLPDVKEDVTKELINKLIKTMYEFKRQNGY